MAIVTFPVVFLLLTRAADLHAVYIELVLPLAFIGRVRCCGTHMHTHVHSLKYAMSECKSLNEMTFVEFANCK